MQFIFPNFSDSRPVYFSPQDSQLIFFNWDSVKVTKSDDDLKYELKKKEFDELCEPCGTVCEFDNPNHYRYAYWEYENVFETDFDASCQTKHFGFPIPPGNPVWDLYDIYINDDIQEDWGTPDGIRFVPLVRPWLRVDDLRVVVEFMEKYPADWSCERFESMDEFKITYLQKLVIEELKTRLEIQYTANEIGNNH